MNTTTAHDLHTLALRGTTAHSGQPRPADDDAGWQPVIHAIAAALPTADPSERAQLRHRLGYIALITGDVRTKALEAFTLMLDDAERLQDRRLEALAHNGLAVTHDTFGQRHRSLEHARKAARLAGELGDQRLLALALNNEAQFYKENGENRRAHEIFAVIQAIGHTLSDDELVMAGHIGLGRTTSMADAFTAVEHYERAIVMARAHGDEMALITCYNNLSDWKINMGLYEEAIALREECLRLSRKLHAREGIGRALIGMAKAYTLQGNFDRARELLNKGMPTVLRAGDLEGDLHASLNLAYLYVQSGDIPRACALYRDVLERSLAAPDHACAIFAQKALELLAEGELPQPAILPSQPVTRKVVQELNEAELAAVVGGAPGLRSELRYTYPTGDKRWYGN